MKLSILVHALAVSLLFAGAAAKADVLSDVKAKGELTVGTEMQFPPFDFLENGKQVGFNADLFAEIGKELGVKVKFIDLPWTSVLPGLEAEKFDMVAGPNTLTKERAEKYYFNLPIAGGAIAILKKAGDATIQKPEDIAGKTIGVQRDSTAAKVLKEYAADKGVTIREYVDNNQAYSDLVAGRLQGVANQSTNLLYLSAQKKGVFDVVMPPVGKFAYFCFLGRKDDGSLSLMKAVDKAILATMEDGRLAAIQTKWFGATIKVPETLPQAD